MMREIMAGLAEEQLDLPETLQFNGWIIEWLGRHLGWDGDELADHAHGLTGNLAGAARLAERWYPRCIWNVSRSWSGQGTAALVVRGLGGPVTAEAPDPANALLLACFEAYEVQQKRALAADDLRLVVAA